MAFRLIPREERFYDDFVALAEQIRRGATMLDEMLAPDRPIWDKADEIKEVEHECDTLTHQIIQRLHRTFVTPLDREDIYSLAKSLDDVMDAIDARRRSSGSIRSTACAPTRANWRASSMTRSTRWSPRLHALEKKRVSPSPPSRSTGSRTRPTRPSDGRPPPLRRGARPDRHHQVEGDPRLPRGRHRPLRGRGQRHRRRRREARLTRMDSNFARRRRAHPRRARLRLHQRLPRRRQLDRHRRLDPRAVAGQGGGLGGVLQLRRRVRLRHRASPRRSARAWSTSRS